MDHSSLIKDLATLARTTITTLEQKERQLSDTRRAAIDADTELKRLKVDALVHIDFPGRTEKVRDAELQLHLDSLDDYEQHRNTRDHSQDKADLLQIEVDALKRHFQLAIATLHALGWHE